MMTLLFISFCLISSDTKTDGKVTLPLADYLALKDAAAKLADQRESEKEKVDTRRIELTEQYMDIVVEEDRFRYEQRFHVVMHGDYLDEVTLPSSGMPQSIALDPPDMGVLSHDDLGGIILTMDREGEVVVTVTAVARISSSIFLKPLEAPVAGLTVTLPTETSWESDQVALVDEIIRGDQKTLRLAPLGNETHDYIDIGLSEGKDLEAITQTRIVTLVDVADDGFRRHDMVAYTVQRGGLGQMAMDLPEGMNPYEVKSDERQANYNLENGKLLIQRDIEITGSGWAVISSRVDGTERLALPPITPESPSLSRFLVVTSALPLEIEPEGAVRVDLEDLPKAFLQFANSQKLLGIYRIMEDTPVLGSVRLPRAETLDAVVKLRETTSVLTRSGTLITQDAIQLEGRPRSLDLELPTDATLWSVLVNKTAVRPIKQGGAYRIPLSLAGGNVSITVLSVQKRVQPDGRGLLNFATSKVNLPVLDHDWDILLPTNRRYRYMEGPLARYTAEVEEVAVSSGNGAIAGQVTSMDGDVLPGTVISIGDAKGSFSRNTISDEDGNYNLANLPPGTYSLTAFMTGMQSYQLKRVKVRPGRITQVQPRLGVSAVQEVLMVTGETPLVDVDAASYNNNLMVQAEAQRQQVLIEGAGLRLQQGTSSGVKPLPFEMPSEGKVLSLSGSMPPQQATARVLVK